MSVSSICNDISPLISPLAGFLEIPFTPISPVHDIPLTPLSPNYYAYWSGIYLQTPPVTQNEEEKDIELQIEMVHQIAGKDPTVQSKLSSLINLIRNSLYSYKEKMIKFAYLIFLFENDNINFHLTINCEHYIWVSSDIILEFEAGISKISKSIKLNYKKINPNHEFDQIPSTLYHAYYDTFSRVLINSGGKLNLGGVFLIQSILGHYFKDESKTQISAVLNQLEGSSDFQKEINSDFTIHANMEQEVRVALKADPKVVLQPCYIKRALIHALFKGLRQFSSMYNCYIISSIIYLTHTEAKTLYRYYKKILVEGTITVGINRLPIETALQNTAISHDWLKTPIECRKIFHSALLRYTAVLLGIHPNSIAQFLSQQQSQINHIDLIRFLVKQEKSPQECELYFNHAINICQSFKLDRIQFLAICALNFNIQNLQKSSSKRIRLLETFFLEIIKVLLEKIGKNLFYQTNPTLQSTIEGFSNQFLNQIIANMLNRVFVEVNMKPNVIRQGPLLYVDGKILNPITFSNQSIDEIEMILRNSTAILISINKGDPPVRVKNIYTFQCFFAFILVESVESFTATSKATPDQLQLFFRHILEEWADFVATSQFREKMLEIQYTHFKNRGYHLTLKELNVLDESEDIEFFRFDDTGSTIESVLEDCFSIPVNISRIVSLTPSEFLTSFMNYYRDFYNIKSFRIAPEETFLAYFWGKDNSSGHAFTIQPYRFREIIKDSRSMIDLINQELLEPAVRLMDSELSEEKKNKFVERFFLNNNIKELIKTYLNFVPTGVLFRDLFKTSLFPFLNQENQYHFPRVFNRIMREVHFQKILDDQAGFLEFANQRGVAIKTQVLLNFLDILKNQYEDKEFSVLFMAKTFQKACKMLQYSIPDQHEIEKILIDYYGLPKIIDIADMNWTDGNEKENPVHDRMVVSVDLTTMNLVFNTRTQTFEKSYDGEFYKDYFIVNKIY